MFAWDVESMIQKSGVLNYLENTFVSILIIFHRPIGTQSPGYVSGSATLPMGKASSLVKLAEISQTNNG